MNLLEAFFAQCKAGVVVVVPPQVVVGFKGDEGTSLVVQCPNLHSPSAADPGLILGQGTRSHMPQLKIQHSQINKYFLKEF